MKHRRFFRSWTWIDFSLLTAAVLTILIAMLLM